MKIIGIQKNVTFKYDGQEFSGMNLYTSEEKPGVEGVFSSKIFINSAKPFYKEVSAAKLGDEIRVYYNRFGKPEHIELIS